MRHKSKIKNASPGVRKLYKKLKKFMKKKEIAKWKDLKEKHVIKFIRKWFKGQENNKKLKPYVVENLIINLQNILDLKTGTVPKMMKARINKIIKRKAQILFEQIEIKRSRADVFDLDTISKAIKTLWKKENDKAKAAAVILAITFTTGARTIDAMRVNVRRMKIEQTEAGRFLIMTLNTSKTNQIGKFQEQLTFKIDENNKIKTDKIIQKWLKYYKPRKNMFKDNFKARHIIYQFKVISRELGLKGTITGHSGRNTTLLQLYKANVDDESKKLFMRWRANSQMPLHYRNILLETSDMGAAAKLAKNKFNQN